MKKLLVVLAVGLLLGSAAKAKVDIRGCAEEPIFFTLVCIPTVSLTLTAIIITIITTRDKKKTAYIQQQEFVAVTIDNLSEQIAQGGGSHLQSLSTLLGCPASAYSTLAIMSRKNYEQLFPAVETEPEVFLTRLKEKMRGNPRLAGRCVYI